MKLPRETRPLNNNAKRRARPLPMLATSRVSGKRKSHPRLRDRPLRPDRAASARRLLPDSPADKERARRNYVRDRPAQLRREKTKRRRRDKEQAVPVEDS